MVWRENEIMLFLILAYGNTILEVEGGRKKGGMQNTGEDKGTVMKKIILQAR